MKKQQRKNDERVGFPDISDSQVVLLRVACVAAGVLADLDPPKFGPPGPNSLADLDPPVQIC